MGLPGLNSQVFEININEFNKDILEPNLYYTISEPKQEKDGWKYTLFPCQKPKNLKNVIKLTIENETNRTS